MRIRPLVVAVALIAVCGAAPALAQSADELFDVNTIQEVRLSVNTRDLRTLRERYQDNTYYTADLAWKNLKLRNVGIRSRGQGSRNPTKLGLRVDMAYYTTGQRFVGLSSLVLDNIWQDDSMLRERLAFTFFERMGQPAPRESFCRLFINNEYQGLYTITEEVDADFVKRVSGETGGNLFEFHWADDKQWRGEDLVSVANYKPRLEARTHVLDADATLYAPVQQLFKEVNGPDDNVWRERVEQYLDLVQFVRHVAIETFIIENDGILGYAGMNNFYLYRTSGSSKHRLFVWDKDNAFLFPGGQISIASDNVIFNRALRYADLKDEYLTTLEQCAILAKTDDFLLREIDRLTAIVHDAAKADTRKQYGNEQYDEAVKWLRGFAASRPDEVLAEVARLRK